MKKFLLTLLLFLPLGIFAQETIDLGYYLPDNISYDPSIPTPKDVIGHEVGEWHVTHDKLVQYMTTLAQVSDRITLENRGTTFEGRPLLLLTVSSPENHANIDRIQREHLSLTEGNATELPIEN